MARAGECPACMQRFDHLARVPMVSVVCGHSLCARCLARRPKADNASMSSSSSDGEDEAGISTCPVCNADLGGFVKNFDALAALEAAASATMVVEGAPDLGSVVQKDLVIRRRDVQFRRIPSEEIGVGASALVYRGMYKGLPVAVKCIRTTSDSWANEDRLRRELRNASRLKNEHIVEFRGAAWDHEAGAGSPRNVLLVTELMAGGNLRESLNLLQEEAGLALESFVHIGLQITKGIEYLHTEGLAHRDIKSANILLTERLQRGVNRFSKEVRAKIADFGLSKYIDKATGGGTVMQSIMEPGRLEATYAYLAPEAFGGDKSNAMPKNVESDDEDSRYDEMAKKRDIYALGVLFWEMLTGQIPWAGISLPDVYVRVCVRSDRPCPALDDAKVSKSVRRLVERCWAQNPTRRPSAKSIAAKLEKIATKISMAEQDTTTATPKRASVAAAVAAEAVSLVSGQAPNVNVSLGTANIPDLHSEPLKEFPDDQRDLSHQGRAPSDSLLSYQKMPSASTVHTTHNEGSKTHSTTGFEASEARDMDRLVEDIPGHFDDTMWIDDGDSYKNNIGRQGSNSKSATNGVASFGNKHVAATGTVSHGVSTTPSTARPVTAGKAQQNVPETLDNAPSSLNRRQVRARHPVDIPEVLQSRIHPSILAAHYSGVAQISTPSPGPSSKSNPTAVAATAAAIAAAKDRERKRDDVRANRGATTRVTRPVNTPSGALGNNIGETSFHSLPSVGDGWQRGISKERQEPRAMFYDNSDEEAQDFDPERAAAEEAIAQSNSIPTTSAVVSRNPNASALSQPEVAQRSSSMNRVLPSKSPVVRRPMSPVAGRKYNVTGILGKTAVEDEYTTNTATGADPVASKRNGLSVSTSRNRLSRTMSASAKTNAAQNRAAPTASPAGVQAALAHSESTGRRAFIRRMRSGDSLRRLGRSTSTTGVEHKRTIALQQPTKNSSLISEAAQRDEDDVEYTVVQIGASPKEDYKATVDRLDKTSVIQLFAQKMPLLRLAGLAHATLISKKHRNEEELLRNSCSILHRLTVPSNSAQSKNSVQEISPKDQLSIRKFLKSNQGVDALLQAMYPPPIRHPTTLSYALLALGNLTAWDLDAHKQFRTSQGVIQIVQVMKTYSKIVGVQEKGCYALACVGAAYPAKEKCIFQETNALDVVIDALSDVLRDSPNDAVTKQACAALGAMCSSSPSNALYAGRKDALVFLVTAFDRFRQASTVDGGKRSEMRLVCKAFIDLLCHAENRKIAGSKGGSAMIMRAMQIFRLDSDFVEKGLATLSEFCTYKSNGMQIVHAGGIDDIVGSMERFRMNINVQREGCKVLTLLMRATGDQARRRLVHAGGAEAAVSALERFGAIPEAHVDMVIEACRSLHALFLMENLSEGEILGRRMKKMKCDKAIKTALIAHRGNQLVQEKGREAVKQLNNLKGGGGLWGRMRNGPKKRQMV